MQALKGQDNPLLINKAISSLSFRLSGLPHSLYHALPFSMVSCPFRAFDNCET